MDDAMDPMLTVAHRLRSAGFEHDLSAAPGARLRRAAEVRG